MRVFKEGEFLRVFHSLTTSQKGIWIKKILTLIGEDQLCRCGRLLALTNCKYTDKDAQIPTKGILRDTGDTTWPPSRGLHDIDNTLESLNHTVSAYQP